MKLDLKLNNKNMKYLENIYYSYQLFDIEFTQKDYFFDKLFIYGYSYLSKKEIEGITYLYMQDQGISNNIFKKLIIISGDKKKIKNSNIINLAQNGNNAFIVGAHPHSIKGCDHVITYLRSLNKGKWVVETFKANRQLGPIQTSSLKTALIKLFKLYLREEGCIVRPI